MRSAVCIFLLFYPRRLRPLPHPGSAPLTFAAYSSETPSISGLQVSPPVSPRLQEHCETAAMIRCVVVVLFCFFCRGQFCWQEAVISAALMCVAWMPQPLQAAVVGEYESAGHHVVRVFCCCKIAALHLGGEGKYKLFRMQDGVSLFV